MTKLKCDKCYETGKYDNGSNDCWNCNGSGYLKSYKKSKNSASGILKDTKSNENFNDNESLRSNFE